jgi:hypothetical protein
MSDAEYNAVNSKPLLELRALPFWQLTRYLERCSRVRREMIYQALAS